MYQGETFSHPSWCPLEALCAVKHAENEWLCRTSEYTTSSHLHGDTRYWAPPNCDVLADTTLMLWGRQTRPKDDYDITSAPTPCSSDADCQKTESCYANRCDVSQTEGFAEKLWTYVNGACGAISPHAKAIINLDQRTIECNTAPSVFLPNMPGEVWDTDKEEDAFKAPHLGVNRYGQIVVAENAETVADLFTRQWTVGAKAEACALCSLYVARTVGYVAVITTGAYAKCELMLTTAVLAENQESCKDLFDDNIFIARAGFREMETLDPQKRNPGYLISGMVPNQKHKSKGWVPFGLMPPLFASNGVPYMSETDLNAITRMPQFSGIHDSFLRTEVIEEIRLPCTLEEATNYANPEGINLNIDPEPFEASQPEECAESCKSRADCGAYTFYANGCYLKAAGAEAHRQSNQAAASGVCAPQAIKEISTCTQEENTNYGNPEGIDLNIAPMDRMIAIKMIP